MKLKILFLILILTLPSVSASIIQGTVYDLSLNKVKNSIVEINTEPKQQIVAKESFYSFNVPKGSYNITARYIVNKEVRSSISEQISVKDEGNYTIDLILVPVLEDIEDLNETEIGVAGEIEGPKADHTFLIIIVIMLTILFLFFRKKKIKETKIETKTEFVSDKLSSDILSFIKKESGRTTQKDIRKAFPMSEAKISLVIAELEEKGFIKKIKKGRGNIIILK